MPLHAINLNVHAKDSKETENAISLGHLHQQNSGKCKGEKSICQMTKKSAILFHLLLSLTSTYNLYCNQGMLNTR